MTMPIFMDRHDVSEEVTAKSVARLHQEDLKVQHQFNCRGLTYWFDDKRKTAFCLVEAPNAESVHQMHKHAHGELPHSIIEVDASLVESFLGRMEDPYARPGTEPQVIDEPAFRFLLSICIRIGHLTDHNIKGLRSTISRYKQKVIQMVQDKQGRLVKQDNPTLLASFSTAQYAVSCGLWLNDTIGKAYPHLSLSMGLDAGPPVEGTKSIFEDTIQNSKRLCDLGRRFSVSPVVLKMYHEERSDSGFHSTETTEISAFQMIFLKKLFNFLEPNYPRSDWRMDTIASSLGYSRSQFYRNAVGLLGCSPNAYCNKYRLEKSLDILDSGINSVSETAYLCGFSSASYYSKCFRKRYGISPKAYLTAILP